MKYYDEILYIVPLNAEFPKPKRVLKMMNAFNTGNSQSFKVKSIEDIEWNEQTNKMMFTLKGEYV